MKRMKLINRFHNTSMTVLSDQNKGEEYILELYRIKITSLDKDMLRKASRQLKKIKKNLCGSDVCRCMDKVNFE